jgi:predicted negative regulator of RcsB-dependent stress response
VDLNLVEDDEQEKARKWWLENRAPIISGVVLGLSIIVGFNWWGDYKKGRAEAASALYQQMLESDIKEVDKGSDSVSNAVSTGQMIIDDYNDTPYSGKAALILARIAFDNGDKSVAKEKLNWAISNSKQVETVHAARLRMAGLLIIEDDLDAALSVLSEEHIEGFESHYYELRGDIYLKQGESSKARDAYRAAIDGLSAGSMYEPVLKMKLDAIATGNIS